MKKVTIQQIAKQAAEIDNPKPPQKDWEAIAREIWDQYDNIALFLEHHMSSHNGATFPFLEKNLPRRFKYFNTYHGKTVTAEEYEKHREHDKRTFESFSNILRQNS